MWPAAGCGRGALHRSRHAGLGHAILSGQGDDDGHGLCQNCAEALRGIINSPALSFSRGNRQAPQRAYPMGLRIRNMESSCSKAAAEPHIDRCVSWMRRNVCHYCCKPLIWGWFVIQKSDYIYIIFYKEKKNQVKWPFQSFMSGKVESIPYRCLLHRLYAAFLCHKMNYRRACKVNQEFFVMCEVGSHGRRQVTGHLLQSAPRVSIKHYFSLLSKASFAPNLAHFLSLRKWEN